MTATGLWAEHCLAPWHLPTVNTIRVVSSGSALIFARSRAYPAPSHHVSIESAPPTRYERSGLPSRRTTRTVKRRPPRDPHHLSRDRKETAVAVNDRVNLRSEPPGSRCRWRDAQCPRQGLGTLDSPPLRTENLSTPQGSPHAMDPIADSPETNSGYCATSPNLIGTVRVVIHPDPHRVSMRDGQVYRGIIEYSTGPRRTVNTIM